ncbi:NAD kinase [Streptomyces sp. NPDC004959]|uniref:NAD kinase n=1 Tax=unclassified Streptomyces TaxID=2593676 RepID=UPI0033A7150D
MTDPAKPAHTTDPAAGIKPHGTDPHATGRTPGAEPAHTVQPGEGPRTVFLLAHTGRPAAIRSAELVVQGLLRCGLGVRVLEEEASDLPLPDTSKVELVQEATPEALDGCELLVVLGGDGTLLRGAELARASGVPMLGVNLGRVGFLAEAERDDLDRVVDRVVTRAYDVEERMTLDVLVHSDGRLVHTDWALNEAAVQKISPERMLEVVLEIDGRPVTGFGCDGIVCATPTGSTAYAFSAGGPVVWPEVEALLMVPISAHALFAKPLVTSPSSILAVEVQEGGSPSGVLWCDGRRTVPLPSGARVEVRRGAVPVRLARLHHASFTDRLVAKFALPVAGWRGAPT